MEFYKSFKNNLTQEFTTELNISKSEFIKRFKEDVDDRSLDFFSEIGEHFIKSKNRLKGQIDDNGFTIKKRRKFFEHNLIFAKANGTFSSHGEKLIIHTTVTSVNRLLYFIPVFALIYFAIAVIILGVPKAPVLIVPFLIVHFAFMAYIFYRLTKKSVEVLKYDLEREYYYLTKND